MLREILIWLPLMLVPVFVINVIPAFMPATRMVLAFVAVKMDIPLLLITVPGVAASGLARLILFKGTWWFRERFLANKAGDLDALGKIHNKHRKSITLLVGGDALTSRPANLLFIASGMAEANPWAMLAGFYATRLVADTLRVWLARVSVSRLGELFQGGFKSWLGGGLPIASLAAIFLLCRLPWLKWVKRWAGADSEDDSGPQRHRRAA